MSDQGCVAIIGGTSGLGRKVAEVLAARGDEVVITGRDKAKAEAVAAQVGGRTRASHWISPLRMRLLAASRRSVR